MVSRKTGPIAMQAALVLRLSALSDWALIPAWSWLRPAKAFELGGGPVDRVIDRVALDGAFGDHFRHRRLRVDLIGDPRRRGAIRDHHYDVATRRIVVDRAFWRRLLQPRLEIVQPGKGRDVVPVARSYGLLDRRALA